MLRPVMFLNLSCAASPNFECWQALRCVLQGTCDVEVEMDESSGTKARVQLSKGDFVGDNILLDEEDWGGSSLIGVIIFYSPVCETLDECL